MDSKFQVLAKLLIKLFECILVLSNFLNLLHTLLDNIFPDNFQNLVLLKHFTRNVKRQILGVNNTLNKGQIVWNQILAIIRDEHSANIKLDVAFRLLVFKLVKGSPLWNEQKCSEFKLTFNREMLYRKMFLPIIGKRFVEFSILLI